MGTGDKKLVIVYAEKVPKSLSVKFFVNELLIQYGVTKKYLSKSETKESPISAKLFEFPFVKEVVITSNFISITKTKNAKWKDVTKKLIDFIRTYINDGKPIINEIEIEKPYSVKTKIKKVGNENLKVQPTETEMAIVEILEQFIVPEAESKGGSIKFKSFNDGIVVIELGGVYIKQTELSTALKSSVAGLLQRMIPEVKKVESASV